LGYSGATIVQSFATILNFTFFYCSGNEAVIQQQKVSLLLIFTLLTQLPELKYWAILRKVAILVTFLLNSSMKLLFAQLKMSLCDQIVFQIC
jgi:hypothetical protein